MIVGRVRIGRFQTANTSVTNSVPELERYVSPLEHAARILTRVRDGPAAQELERVIGRCATERRAQRWQ